MNERLLFPNMMLIKRWVAETFVTATRTVYADHPVYTHRDDDTTTGVYIAPTYADSEAPGKKPKILVQGGGYSFGLKDTLGRNLAYETLDRSHAFKQVRVGMMVLVQAYAEEESSDLADELAMLLSTAAHDFYAAQGLVIDAVDVSETNVLDPEAKSFQTTLNLVVEVPVEITAGATGRDGGVDIDLGLSQLRTRTPAVTVFRKSISDA